MEFYSLSKSYNLTGARISFVIGNQKIVDKFRSVRTQFDYGVFLPIQYGAAAALNGPQDAVLAQCEEYERRNQAFCGGLRGFQVGGAQVSEKHCGFVINTGDATAEDVTELIRQVAERVKAQSGVTLEPEVKLLGEF